MQKVLAGNTGSLPEFADYLNETFQNPPAELGRLVDASGDKWSTI